MALTRYPVGFTTLPTTPAYARILTLDGQAWDPTLGTPAFVTYNSANYSNYCINLTQQGGASSHDYYLPTPATLPAGTYTVAIHTQASATANTRSESGDAYLNSGLLNYDGANIVDAASRQASFTASTGVTFPTQVASPTNITAGTVTTVSGNVSGSVGSVAGNVSGSVASVTARVTANTDQWGGVVVTGMPMPTYAQPGGFLAASFPAAVSSFAGGAVASVTGNVGGNVAGSVASVTARVTANTDQLAGQAVSAAAAVTFPASVASPTNITAGTITTATNLTNAPTAGDFTAAMKASLNASTPASVGSVTNPVTVGTNNDKTGYSLTTAPPTAAAIAASIFTDPLSGSDFSTAGSFGALVKSNLDAQVSTRAAAATALSAANWPNTLAAALTTLASHDPGATIGTSTLTQTQVTGGAYPLSSASAVLGDARVANLDAAVSSRSTYAGADTAGTSTLLGRLTATRAGLLDNLDAAVSSRLAAAGYTTPPGVAAIAAAVFTDLLSGADFSTAGSFGKLVKDYLDAAVSSRLAAAGYTAPDNTTLGYYAGLLNAGHTAFTPTALANAPTGSGSGSGATLAQIQSELDGRNLTTTYINATVGSRQAAGAAVTLPANPPANFIAATSIAAGALNGKGDWLLASGYTAPNNAGIASIAGKLPVNSIADETLLLAAIGTPQQAGGAVTLPAAAPAGFLTAAAVAAGALSGKGDWLSAAQTGAAVVNYVVGNGRTVGYYLQGGTNRTEFAADGLSFTVYGPDDVTPLDSGSSLRFPTAVGGLRKVGH